MTGVNVATPVRLFYSAGLLAFVLLSTVLYVFARPFMVSVFAILGGVVEIAAARLALSGEQEEVKFPRMVFHLLTVGFLFLVASAVWQQILQSDCEC